MHLADNVISQADNVLFLRNIVYFPGVSDFVLWGSICLSLFKYFEYNTLDIYRLSGFPQSLAVSLKKKEKGFENTNVGSQILSNPEFC